MRRRVSRPVAATALLALVVLAAAMTTPWVASAPELPAIVPSNPAEFPSMSPEPAETATPGPVEDHLNDTARDVIALVAGLLLLALLAWIGAALARRLRDRYAPEAAVPQQPPPGQGVTAPGGEELAAAVQDAVERALTIVDRARGVPRDAVVAAWVALEDAATGLGAERDPAHTPTEFTAALLAATPAPAADVAVLRHLYQRARFTRRPVTDDDVAAARAALEHIARVLDTAPGPAHDEAHDEAEAP